MSEAPEPWAIVPNLLLLEPGEAKREVVGSARPGAWYELSGPGASALKRALQVKHWLREYGLRGEIEYGRVIVRVRKGDGEDGTNER